ncbi:MAG: FkbM family methyltransferase [Bacteroidales bacterium]|nr:FkbM family methyltransferase [Bacteroidales bacterium]
MNLEIIKYFFSKSYRSFSQNGEDLLLNKYFQGKKKGFYVDVGANHPIILNNTYFFYRRGWRGILIEGNKSFNKLYKIFRPNDIVINEFVSNKEEECYYHHYNEHVFNHLSKEKLKIENLKHTEKIITKPLDKILNSYLTSCSTFDLLSVDIEGESLNAIKTLPHLIKLPEVILIEVAVYNFLEILDSDEFIFLKSLGYDLFSSMFNNLFFRKISE